MIMETEPQDPELISNLKDDVPRISPEIFVQLFDNHSKFDNFTVIDCRTAYEYNGGHIKGSLNYSPLKGKHVITNLYHRIWKSKSIYIFHCEFSVSRGPLSWRQFNEAHMQSINKDRPLHAFVLDGGYREFHKLYPNYCDGKFTPEKK